MLLKSDSHPHFYSSLCWKSAAITPSLHTNQHHNIASVWCITERSSHLNFSMTMMMNRSLLGHTSVKCGHFEKRLEINIKPDLKTDLWLVSGSNQHLLPCVESEWWKWLQLLIMHSQAAEQRVQAGNPDIPLPGNTLCLLLGEAQDSQKPERISNPSGESLVCRSVSSLWDMPRKPLKGGF